ncbi:hypothetical protein HMPREF9444_01469 [Succinatimonas hippei YIT 12066]|uniref:Uncharacterized protein n=1 Tax=Succinatimonas hippei (strain DSM 22608 / JCM 16073 / KCTC 15190 / YIT 12066) TaxID=762983 RepID=E8LL63_SUCHY|nr:hypothetical protein HMPREF9444_01469 [Succinatimonas hippei YIT 12066]
MLIIGGSNPKLLGENNYSTANPLKLSGIFIGNKSQTQISRLNQINFIINIKK